VHETTQTLLFALVAGLSPLALVATLAALGSGRGRVNGAAFAVGFLVTQSLVLLVAIGFGSAATSGRERGHETFAAGLELLLGIALLLFAIGSRAGRGRPSHSGDSRTKAIMGRLAHLRPATAFSAGALLGVGGLKRLTITLLAGATIGVAGLIPAEQGALAALYVVIATAFVWLPVAVYLVAGARADAWNARAQGWLMANERQVTEASALVFGLLLIGHGVARLV
jgi:hypothetical protein